MHLQKELVTEDESWILYKEMSDEEQYQPAQAKFEARMKTGPLLLMGCMRYGASRAAHLVSYTI